jgi:methylmalonyl-CoA mutase N-terminal domain/subunit
MFSEEVLRKIQAVREKYERDLEEILSNIPGAEFPYRTFSGIQVKPLYTPEDLSGVDFIGDISFPGSYPYTRGVFPAGYLSRGIHIRQVTGVGTAEETNKRWKFLLSKGANALSVVP